MKLIFCTEKATFYFTVSSKNNRPKTTKPPIRPKRGFHLKSFLLYLTQRQPRSGSKMTTTTRIIMLSTDKDFTVVCYFNDCYTFYVIGQQANCRPLYSIVVVFTFESQPLLPKYFAPKWQRYQLFIHYAGKQIKIQTKITNLNFHHTSR